MNEPKGDIIFLENLRVFGKHGAYEEERKVEQEFIINVMAWMNTEKAGASDNLSDTVNYVDFRTIAEEVVQKQSYYLVEKIAEQITEHILKDGRMSKVSVTIKKPTVLPNGIPGVTITRVRK